MAPTDRDVNFRLRAQDLTSRTMAEVTSASDRLTSSIDHLVEAAKSGEASTTLLNEVLREMKETQDQLSRQNTLIQQFRDQTQRVDELSAKLETARNEYNEYRAALAGSGAEINENDRRLTKLGNSVASAERRLNTAAVTLGRISGDLSRAGIDTRELDTAQAHIAKTFDASVIAANKLDGALTNYQRNLRDTRAEQARVAEAGFSGINPADISAADTEQSRRQTERSAAAARDYVNFWTRALDEIDEANRVQVAAQEARTKQAADEYVAWWTNALNQVDAQNAEKARVAAENSQLATFRSQAEQAQQAIGSLAQVEARTTGTTGTLEAALRQLADPTEQTRSSMTGLIGEVDRLDTVVNGLKGVTANYLGTARELSDVQRGLTGQAALIDSYRRQESAVQSNAAALAYWRGEFDQYVRLVRNAAAPNDELAQGLDFAKRQVQQLTAEVQRDNSALASLSERLKQAGIDARNLGAAEAALRDSAQKAASAQARLATATTGKGARGVQGLFGLKPYELQNLGFQINDVFTQLASGASITQTFAQQGGQILQIFPGLFSTLARGAAILAPAIAVITAYGIAVNRLSDQQAELRRFTGVLAANADGARYNAAALLDAEGKIKSYGVSAEDAGNAIQTFIQNGVNPSQIITFGEAVKNVSDVFGTEFKQNADSVSQAFTRGYKAIADYDNQLNFLTESERNRVKALFDSGDAETGRSEAFRIFSERMQEAADKSNGPWTTAFRKLRDMVSSLFDYLSKTGVVQGFVSWMDKLAVSAGNAAERISTIVDGTPMEKAQQRFKDLNDEIERRKRLQNDIATGIQPLPLGVVTAGDQPTGGASTIPDRQDTENNQRLRDLAVQRRDALNDIRMIQKDTVVTSEQEAAAQQAAADAAEAERKETERRNKIGDDELNRLALELGAHKENSNAVKIQTAGQQAYNRLIDAGASVEKAEAARRLAEDDKRRSLAAEDAKKAETERNKKEAAAQRLVNLERSLAAAGRGQDTVLDKLGVDDLDTKLTGIDQKFDDIIAKAREFQKLGGTNVRGQTIDQFVDETNQQREQVKQLTTLQHYQDVANATLAQRKDLVEVYNNLVQAGLMTETEAQQKIQAAYQATNPLIQQQITDAQTLLQTLRDNGTITATVYDEIIAKLQLVQSQLNYVPPAVVKIRETVQSSIEDGVVSLFDSAAQSIAGLIDQTMSWNDALMGIVSTIGQVAAQFLKDVAMMILKLYALKLAQEITGINPSGGGAGAGGAGGGGGDFISKTLDFLGIVLHSGTDSVGGGAGKVSRRVSPLAFVGAPRYHDGVRGLGLKPNERAAILEKGETVLAKGEANPMLVSGDSRPISIRSVLYDDPSRIAEIMAGSAGEQVIEAKVIRMVPTLRQLLTPNK